MNQNASKITYHICLKYAKKQKMHQKQIWNSRYTCRQCVKTKKVWKAWKQKQSQEQKQKQTKKQNKNTEKRKV